MICHCWYFAALSIHLLLVVFFYDRSRCSHLPWPLASGHAWQQLPLLSHCWQYWRMSYFLHLPCNLGHASLLQDWVGLRWTLSHSRDLSLSLFSFTLYPLSLFIPLSLFVSLSFFIPLGLFWYSLILDFFVCLSLSLLFISYTSKSSLIRRSLNTTVLPSVPWFEFYCEFGFEREGKNEYYYALVHNSQCFQRPPSSSEVLGSSPPIFPHNAFCDSLGMRNRRWASASQQRPSRVSDRPADHLPTR